MPNPERVRQLHGIIDEFVRERVSGEFTVYFSDGGVMKALMRKELL